MHKHKLYLQPEKCEFEQTNTEYLGIIIFHNKVEMDPVKVAGVINQEEGAVICWICKLLLLVHSWIL
jgi:hypothetical protein